jgi:hypothetical protein
MLRGHAARCEPMIAGVIESSKPRDSLMKRLLGLLVVLIPMALFAAGCGGGSGSDSSKKVIKPDEMQMPPDIAKKFQKGAKK